MKTFIVLLLAVIIPSTASAREGRYCAMVMDVTGTVNVVHRGETKHADLGHLLYSGDEVKLAGHASLTIDYLESGREEIWSEGKRFVVGKAASTPEPGKVGHKDKIALPGIEFQRVGAHKLRYASSPEVTVKGLSNTRIIEQRPVFRWEPIAAADRYRITLRSADKNVLWQKTTNATELSYPEDMLPLQYGTRYEWAVEALVNEETIAEKTSCFLLPGKPDSEKIHQRLQADICNYLNEPMSSVNHLAMILFLKEHMLYDDEFEQYQELQKVFGKSESVAEELDRIIKIRKEDCLSLMKD